MKFNIVESKDHDCVFSRARGTFNAAHLREAHRQSLALELVRAGAPVVNDMRFVNFSVRTSETMTVRNLPFAAHARQGKRRIAFVAGSTLGFGMLRIIAAMREYDHQITDVFREFQHAFDWIQRPALGDALPDSIDRSLDAPGEKGAGPDDFDLVIGQA